MKSLVCLALLLAACRSGVKSPNDADHLVGVSFSALPQVGVGLLGATRLSKRPEFNLLAELEGTLQFLDDSDLADDGGPGAGNFTQVRLGLKYVFTPDDSRHLVARYGVVWLESSGEPILLDEAGEYAGGYGGIGFETEISKRWSVGPEFRLLVVDGLQSQGIEVIPQFAWHFTFRF